MHEIELARGGVMNSLTAKAPLLVVTAVVALAFGFASERASAAYGAKVSQGVLTITGDSASDKLALRLKPGVPNILQVDVGADGSANFSFDRSTFDKVIVHAGGGDDIVRIAEGNGAFTDTEKTAILGDGSADTLVGGSFAESLQGGDGADTIDGNPGNDAITLGASNDFVVWNPEDGVDAISAGDGFDRIRVNGSDDSESIEVFNFTNMLRISRGTRPGEGGPIFDAKNAEALELKPLRGNDVVRTGNLAGTGVNDVSVDLASGSPSEPRDFDNVVLNGAIGPDNNAQVSAFSGTVKVVGLAPTLSISHSDPGLDLLDVSGFSGNDTLKASDGIGSLMRLTLHGNDAADVLIGADGAETLDGGDGGDFLEGNSGNDVLLAGLGKDFLDGGLGIDILDCGLLGSIDTIVPDAADTLQPNCF
jgi:Ca2+-binding RTX toxin-like protein